MILYGIGEFMDRAQRLGSENTGKLLMEFSLPAIVGMVVQALYNIVDRIFVGNGVGTLAITGITICFPLMIVFMAFGMLIGMGGSSLFSIRFGEGKREEAERILGNTFMLLVIVSIALCAITGIFLEPLLRLFGASDKSLPYASAYLGLILYGVPLQAVGFGMNNFIRAEGRPVMAMATMLIGAILNVILAPLFIFVFHMGIRGAAIATITAQGISCIWVMHFFMSSHSLFGLHGNNMVLVMPVVRRILTIGLAPFFMQIGASLVVGVFNHQLIRYGGDVAVSVFGIVHSITMLTVMPVIAISQGAQPIMGFNFGARAFDRVKSTMLQAIRAATALVSAGFILAMIAPDHVIRLFNPADPELRRIGVHALRIFLAMLPLVGFQICVGGYFQAVGKPRQGIFLTLSRQIIVLVPCLLILPRFFGLSGIWMVSPVSDFTAFVLSLVLFAREMRALKVSV